MMKRLLAALTAVLSAAFMLAAPVAWAENVPTVTYPDGSTRPATPVICLDKATNTFFSCASGSGGGGGGGGDASAANQSTQITAANLTNTTLGATSDSACASDAATCSMIALLKRENQRLTSLITAVGSPLQAGGSVGITGSLPGYATPPTVIKSVATYQLLSNASATGSTATGVVGDGYVYDLRGTLGGATVTLQVSDAAGTLQTAATCTAVPCTSGINIGQGSSVRAVVTGGSPSGLYFSLQGLGGPATSTSSGGSSTVILPNRLIAGAVLTRPADTTAYALGDLVANSTTAGSVVPLSFTVATTNDQGGTIRGVRLKTNNTAWAGYTVRLHLHKNAPTFTNGDNGAWLTTESEALGCFDVTFTETYSDAVKGYGVSCRPGGEMPSFTPSSGTVLIYGDLEIRQAATPASGQTFTPVLEIETTR